MIVNDLMVQAEVEAEFAAYEQALVDNDVAALDDFFARIANARSAMASGHISMTTIRVREARRDGAPALQTRIAGNGGDLRVAAKCSG